MKIAVIGAGIIGVSIAVEAAARGADVRLPDRRLIRVISWSPEL